MSFFTRLLETTGHFGDAIKQAEEELETSNVQNGERLKQLVRLSYYYAHVQLQKGVAAADAAIGVAESIQDERMKANALCARSMNEFRIGYLSKAKSTAQLALTIFRKIDDQHDICDALFQLGAMPHISVGAGDTPTYLDDALKRYTALGDAGGVYLVRIQRTIHLFYATQFAQGESEFRKLMAELTYPHLRHLLCFAYQQFALGLHIKEDVVQFMKAMLEWQPIAEANGNHHDLTMTKCMLPDCYRLQHLNKDVMKACLEGMEYAEKLGSVHGTCVITLILAHICDDQGQYEDALRYFKKVNELAYAIEDGYKYRRSLNSIGSIYSKLGLVAKSRQALATVEKDSLAAGDRINLVSARRYLAELAYKQSEFDRALFAFKILIDTADNRDGLYIQDYGNYSACIAKASNASLRKAGFKIKERNSLRLQYLTHHLELAQQQHNTREEANAFNNLADYYEEANDLRLAIQYRKKYIILYTQLVNEESSKNMANLRMQYEYETKEKEIELLKRESEQALLNERLRISSELHDEVGATLSGIAMYSHLTKSQIKNANIIEVEKSLNIMQQSAGEMVSKLNDIVWLVNPRHDSIQDLVRRLDEYAGEMALAKNMQVKVSVPLGLDEHSLPVESRRNIYLFCKEAINNAVKYSGGTLLELIINDTSGILEFIVKDNGKGFDPVMVKRGNGLDNMQKRAEEIGARLLLQSKKDEGSLLSMRLKIA